MSISSWLLIGGNAAVLAAAAIVLWLRGRSALAAFFTAAVAMHFIGLAYILSSEELPGFNEKLSTTYRFFDFLTNFGYLAHSVAVLAVCISLTSVQPITNSGPASARRT